MKIETLQSSKFHSNSSAPRDIKKKKNGIRREAYQILIALRRTMNAAEKK